MNEEIKMDYCILGGGIAGILLASKLASSDKKISIVEQGPRFSEEYRTNMMLKSKVELNDYADYNDNVDYEILTRDLVCNGRLFIVEGSALS